MSDFRIFETDQFQDDLKKIFSSQEEKTVFKLREYVYPQLRQQLYFGKNIKKLRAYKPETWRYRIGITDFSMRPTIKRKLSS